MRLNFLAQVPSRCVRLLFDSLRIIMQPLREVFHDWLKDSPRGLESAAAFKDFAALLEQAPYVTPLRSHWDGCCVDLIEQVADLTEFL